jgi:hypothetical protein
MFKFQLLLVTSFLLISVNIYAAEKNPILDETFSVALGIYQLSTHTQVATKSNVFNNREYKIDIDNLGLDTDVDSYWLEMKWRPFKRWAFITEYFSYSESGSNSRSVETVYKNTIFGANARLDTNFDIDIFSISAAYRIVDDQNYAIDFGAGLHTLDISFDIEGAGDVYINDNVISAGNTREAAKLLAPLPNVMLFGTYAFNKEWAVSGRVGWMSLNYENYQGDLLRANTVIDYRPFENFGLGLGYNFSELDITREQRLHSESFDMDFSGPILYLKAGF